MGKQYWCGQRPLAAVFGIISMGCNIVQFWHQRRRWYNGQHSCLPSSWSGFDSRPTQLFSSAHFYWERKFWSELIGNNSNHDDYEMQISYNFKINFWFQKKKMNYWEIKPDDDNVLVKMKICKILYHLWFSSSILTRMTKTMPRPGIEPGTFRSSV